LKRDENHDNNNQPSENNPEATFFITDQCDRDNCNLLCDAIQPSPGEPEFLTDENKFDTVASFENTLQNNTANFDLEETATRTLEAEPLFYLLKVTLIEGRRLAIRDIGGSSDPYAKFFLNSDCVYKSKIIYRNLNPVWNEEFFLRLPKCIFANESMDNIKRNISFKAKLTVFIYDYDRGFFNDDLIGFSSICIDNLEDDM
jgi:hypothetical protein